MNSESSLIRRRLGLRRGISLLPNLLTTANLFCGFFSITKTLQEQYVFAAWLVVLAGIFDFLDGRVARMTNSQSDFGVEYDSLSDLTTFCMAPSLLIYQWSLVDFGKFGIAACFLFFCCGALRLARYNVQSGEVEKVDFQGLPTPAGGGFLVSFVIFSDHVFGPGRFPSSIIVLGMTLGMALLMVSNVQYRSAKRVKRGSFQLLVMIVAVLFVIAAQPEVMLFVIGSSYIALGLVVWIIQSPQKIRGIKDLLVRVYNDRDERFVYEEDDEEGSGGDVLNLDRREKTK